MKILAYVVRVECEACHGKKRVRARENDPNGETVDCANCNGLGHEEGVVPLADVVKLIRGLAEVEIGEARKRVERR